MLNCTHYLAGKCRSCHWLEVDYSQQLYKKEQDLRQQLQPFLNAKTQWHPSVASIVTAMRNKAKMAVAGAVEKPILGIISDPQNFASAVDLSDCLLYPSEFSVLFNAIKLFIGRAGLVPYNTSKQKGELKYILLTQSQSSKQFMLRLVLRSENKLPLIRRELPQFLQQNPQVSVVTANIQPQHAAILEGEQEIFLTTEKTLAEQFNHIPLFIRPQGFFQTNPNVAAILYRTAQQWTNQLPIHTIWDLFCGVGGFGLHCATARQNMTTKDVYLTGIEISASAIEAATLSAQQIGLKNIHFQALDATKYPAQSNNSPDLVIVNPPRRGIGEQLANYLNQLQANYLLYSSCNAISMAKDMAFLSKYKLTQVQLFDMFPHTSHYETLALLVRS